MAQNTVQSTGVLYPEDVVVYIATYSTTLTNDSLSDLTGKTYYNLGALSEFSVEAKIETSQPASINVEHEQIVTKMTETINITIQELNQTYYNMLMGSAAYTTSVDGSATTAVETYTAGSLASEKFYRFKNQHYASGVITLSTAIIISGSSTFVEHVSYEVMKDNEGYYGFWFQSTGAFTSTMAITVANSYTPLAQSILIHGGADQLTPFCMKVYSVYADGRTLTNYYPNVNYVSGGSITPKNNGSGEYKDMKFSLEGREHPTWTYSGNKVFRIDIQTTATT